MYGVGRCFPCLPAVWGVHNGTSFSDFFSYSSYDMSNCLGIYMSKYECMICPTV